MREGQSLGIDDDVSAGLSSATAFPGAPVDRDDVRNGYRLLLGRDPEDAVSVNNKVGLRRADLVRALLSSPEFRAYLRSLSADDTGPVVTASRTTPPPDLIAWATSFFSLDGGLGVPSSLGLLLAAVGSPAVQAIVMEDTGTAQGDALKMAISALAGSQRQAGFPPQGKCGDGKASVPMPKALRSVPAATLLFDAEYYTAQAGPCDEPLRHYRQSGWLHGYDPHPLFCTRHYCGRHDLGGDDPVTHFACIGQWANASTHPLLDGPAFRPARGTPGSTVSRARHPVIAYLADGPTPDGQISTFFSDTDYMATYPDVAMSGIPPLFHYLRHGWRENRRPHRDFDPALFTQLAGLPADREPYGVFASGLERLRACTVADVGKAAV